MLHASNNKRFFRFAQTDFFMTWRENCCTRKPLPVVCQCPVFAVHQNVFLLLLFQLQRNRAFHQKDKRENCFCKNLVTVSNSGLCDCVVDVSLTQMSLSRLANWVGWCCLLRSRRAKPTSRSSDLDESAGLAMETSENSPDVFLPPNLCVPSSCIQPA